MIGSTLLHYAIDARLGEGGMGTVYRARDTVLMRTVAIKVLSSVAPDAARRLLQEARSASALNHPNIVTIYAVEQHEATAFISGSAASRDRASSSDGVCQAGPGGRPS
jgi:serine/threonine protein kinase